MPEEHIEQLKDEKDKFHDLKVLKESKGGEILIATVTQDILNTMRKLGARDKDPLSATLKANLDLLALLMGAKENEEAVDEMIKDTLSA